MNRSFSTSTFLTSTFLASTCCAITLTLPLSPATAQPLPALPIQFNPDTIQNPGRPGGRRRGGGSRGDCLSGNIPLSAIAYADSRTVSELGIERTDETVGMLTTQARPMLWFYLPSELSDETETAFVVKDSRDQVLYQGQLAGETDRDGVVGLPMAVELSPGSAYQWFLTMDCGGGEQATVNGWVGRKSADAAMGQMLEGVSDRNRAALYANYGFLQDTLSELAALQLADAEANTQDWASFLSTLGLSDLSAAPLLDCCQLADAQAPSIEAEIEETEREEIEAVEPIAPEPEETEAPEERDPRTILERARDRG